MRDKMDLLYIHPPKLLKKSGFCIMPTGVIALMNLLKEKGYKVRGVNLGLERSLNRRFDLEKWLKDKEIPLIAMDLHWYEHIFGLEQVAKVCKKANKDVKIVLGGFTASIFAKEILKAIPEVDFVIKGDGEVPLGRLVEEVLSGREDYIKVPNLFYKDKGEILKSPLRYVADTLGGLNFVDISFLENDEIYLRTHIEGVQPEGSPLFFSLCVGRGCIYNCLCCGGAQITQEIISGRSKLLKREPETIVKDLEYLGKLGIKKVWPTHDLQMFGEDFWRSLFFRVRQRGIKVGLGVEIWQRIPKKEFIEDFSKTFLIPYSAIIFSPLSGSERVRQLSGKYYSNEEFFICLDFLREKAIPLELYFSFYLPGESYDDFKETINIIKKVSKIYPLDSLLIVAKPLFPDPGCPLSLNSKVPGVVLNKKTFFDYYKVSKEASIGDSFSPKKIGYRLSSEDVSLRKMQMLWSKEKARILLRKVRDRDILKKKVGKLWQRLF